MSVPASVSAAATVPSAAAHRSRETTAYDFARYASVIDWTPTSLLIRGKPVALLSAEFHYFRVPDRVRWRPILLDIKAMGFNAVRLYIHWGYHSPAEGVYNFRGNRDIDFLLALCAELQLFVIAAPGPYICAEVQAGGFPIWLIAKRHLRVRHMSLPPLGLVKKWDHAFHAYCVEYMRKILSFLVKYELTTNPNGCIIALQIENELRQPPVLGVGGLDQEIRLMCEVARQAGSTVPIFHNDDSPIGSWSAGDDYRSARKLFMKTGRKAYRTDLYGFDLYFTFPPGDRSGDLSSIQVGMLELFGVSACLNCCGIGGAGVGGSDTACLSCLYENGSRRAPPPRLAWAATKQMENAVDSLEKKLNGFNGSARHAPAFVAETQVGWINQWGRFRTYDDIYNFFGDWFSATLQNSLLAQGVTFANHYIAYGGTNHGTVGDTEVYSSYDYSAFIREFGMLSKRGRVLRHVMLFARSFAERGLSDSVLSEAGGRGRSTTLSRVKATVPTALLAVRRPNGNGTPAASAVPNYAFLRNLKVENLRFNLLVDGMVLPCQLTRCESMVAPLYYNLDGSNLSIFACTVPVVCRTTLDGNEMWVLRVRPGEVGHLVLKTGAESGRGRQGVAVKWAKLSSQGQGSGGVSSGEVSATDQDHGAATSLLSAALEELPLSGQTVQRDDQNPFAVRTSTEDVGLCFTFSFNVETSSVLAIRDLSEDGSSSPVLRLLCLTDEDSLTFTADLNGNDIFKPTPNAPGFAAAWGVSRIAFEPSGVMDVGFRATDQGKTLFLLREDGVGMTPEQFDKCPSAVSSLLPGLVAHRVPEDSVSMTVRQSVDNVNPLSKDFEIELGSWSKRIIDWEDDVVWKRISYDQRDPLDHYMTSGHIAYRMRFRSSSKSGSLTINVRHSAVIWCNGKSVGGQVCFSHNTISAGAMHAVDLQHAGKKTHDLSEALRTGPDANGFHNVVILVLSLGQSRSPFLLNDVRNRRGLLSARLSRRTKARDITWELAGVDVTRSDDAYGMSGLPLESDVNTAAYDVGFSTSPSLDVTRNDGLVFYRNSFRVPPNSILGGSVRYPLRIRVVSGAHVRVMIWVNTLFMGRYVEDLGPQSDFYVPEGLIKDYKGNSIVLGVYGPVDTDLSVKILPWVVNPVSGNLDDTNGEVYALKVSSFQLDSPKGI
ncbi:beta-galactosidase family GH35 [Chondrus crispus]|uniref:beta-galactosidase n=1 Tax=Chondrus crispus TaxID=2769 RepID=R7Q9G8_CHOCR|nr:beta-galactosidase family GH35 [Chondrus crispus]CDF34120.1 beta-galactosidase family GH35 [Chondrus crispus]|eukprot:XP_005713939.1 beta-galactosidase family GH35 [Chondrus crispus]